MRLGEGEREGQVHPDADRTMTAADEEARFEIARPQRTDLAPTQPLRIEESYARDPERETRLYMPERPPHVSLYEDALQLRRRRVRFEARRDGIVRALALHSSPTAADEDLPPQRFAQTSVYDRARLCIAMPVLHF